MHIYTINCAHRYKFWLLKNVLYFIAICMAQQHRIITLPLQNNLPKIANGVERYRKLFLYFKGNFVKKSDVHLPNLDFRPHPFSTNEARKLFRFAVTSSARVASVEGPVGSSLKVCDVLVSRWVLYMLYLPGSCLFRKPCCMFLLRCSWNIRTLHYIAEIDCISEKQRTWQNVTEIRECQRLRRLVVLKLRSRKTWIQTTHISERKNPSYFFQKVFGNICLHKLWSIDVALYRFYMWSMLFHLYGTVWKENNILLPRTNIIMTLEIKNIKPIYLFYFVGLTYAMAAINTSNKYRSW